jgi:thioredoxin reductase
MGKLDHLREQHLMKDLKYFDVIVIGGSYSGLAAGMALGRAQKEVLIIDNEKPCNIQTPHSHNFITQDGNTPKEISIIAKQQVGKYKTVSFFSGLATVGVKTSKGFEIHLQTGDVFGSKKLIFATGIKDILPNINGISECWGISVLHCPYCHGYEVRNEKTGIIGNGESGYELTKLISNWTNDLTLYTNGQSSLTDEQMDKLKEHNIQIEIKKIDRLEHDNGNLKNIVFSDNTKSLIKAIYLRTPFEQHCKIPEALGCEFIEDGYIKVDQFQETTVQGVYACGDNVNRVRTVANAVAMGTTAGMMLSKKMIMEDF